MKNFSRIPVVVLAAILSLAGGLGLRAAAAPTGEPPAPVSLAGEWRFAMDRGDAGMKAEWFKQDLREVVKTLAATAAPGDKIGDSIQLPGILQGEGYGDDISTKTPWVLTPRIGSLAWPTNPEYAKFSQPGNVSVSYLSQPPKHYIGVAWYQRDIDIPADWAGKRVELFLERAHWQSSVWVDEQYAGFGDSLVTPHVTDLGLLKPGAHRLTIRVDNNMMYRQRVDGHSVSDGLGATWNGIVGRIELSATTPVWIADAQVFPNIAKESALIKVRLGNLGGHAGAGTITVSRTGGAVKATAPVKWDASGGTAEIEVPYGGAMVLWNEFHPNIEHLTLQLAGDSADDTKLVTFGFREITYNDKDMLLNGQLVNMRMTHDGGDFPLTGYPAMDVATWKRIMLLCKSYGLNGMRFHSWCPPEAAFEAADELGFYLQPECGFWDSFSTGSPMAKRLDDETSRLLAAYGNHPSFILLSPSNESGGSYPPVWAAKNYQTDSRRLYSAGTGNDAPEQLTGGAQYAVMPHTTKSFPNGGGLLRTISSDNAVWLGGDYRAGLRNVHIPLLGHENGQWCAYPDFDVIKEYTGYLRPGNFEIFRDSAAQNGVLDRNKEFSWASGKFQLMCDKEEIETLMRTPGMAGFQLLDLHDNTEQGTALIGVVDPLWQPKSYVTAAEFHRFAGPTVPLARLAKHTFTTAESLETNVELYHFGAEPITGAKPYWKLVDAAGATVAGGQWDARDLPLGKNIPLGHVSLNLASIPAPREYKLVVGITGASAENDWNIWVYPAPLPEAAAPPADVFLTSSWADAETRLAAGGKVLFTPRANELGNASPALSNVSVFWNRQMNPPKGGANGESMLGLWCDAQHPALAEYPTEGFCDWEWTVLVRGAHAINIASAPADLKPIVSAVDDWNRNWKLGVIFEAKIGSGRLLVSAISLADTRTSPPNVAQLRRSLVDYMAGDKFQPKTTLTPAQVRTFWAASAATGPILEAPPEIDAAANAPPQT